MSDPALEDAITALYTVFATLVVGCTDSEARLVDFGAAMDEVRDLATPDAVAPPVEGQIAPIKVTPVDVAVIPNGATVTIPVATSGNSTILLGAWSQQGGQVETPAGFIPHVAHPDRSRLILFSRYFADPTEAITIQTSPGNAQDRHGFVALEYAGHLELVDANAQAQENNGLGHGGSVDAAAGALVVGLLGCNSDEPWMRTVDPWSEVARLVEDNATGKSFLSIAAYTGTGLLNPTWEDDPDGPHEVDDPGESQTCIGIAAAFGR